MPVSASKKSKPKSTTKAKKSTAVAKITKAKKVTKISKVSKLEKPVVVNKLPKQESSLQNMAKPEPFDAAVSEQKAYIHTLTSVLIIFLIIASIGAAWTYLQFRQAQNEINKISYSPPEHVAKDLHTNDFVEQIKKYIVVPTDENPFVAVVADQGIVAQLQPFFADAKTSDVLIMYSDKAIIYRPSIDKIVTIGPVLAITVSQINNISSAASSTTMIAEREVLTLDIRNGSRTPGKAATTAKNLGDLERYEPIQITNAANYDYPQTLLINLSEVDVSELKELYNIEPLVDLPAGEVDSEADVVIILGNDL